jgi:hypothetical protein
LAGEEVAGFKQELAQRSGAALLRRKRTKVAILAVLFGVVSSVIELPLPLEDVYRAARAELRSRPAPRDIVMIAIDDKTRAANNYNLPNRLHGPSTATTDICGLVKCLRRRCPVLSLGSRGSRSCRKAAFHSLTYWVPGTSSITYPRRNSSPRPPPPCVSTMPAGIE